VNWQWVTGETFSFTSWATNEPNNFGCSGSVEEDNIQLTFSNVWNDAGWCACYQYIVEYETGSFSCPAIEEGNCPGSCVPPCGTPGGGGGPTETCGCERFPSLSTWGLYLLILSLSLVALRYGMRPARVRRN